VDQMPHGHHRVVPDHARSGVTHYFLDALTHLRFVAVYGAVLTGGFIKSEGTFFQALFCIRPDLGTLLAEWIWGVIMAAVQADH